MLSVFAMILNPVLAFATPTTYSSEDAFVGRTIVRTLPDGTYFSYVIVRADKMLEVNHLDIQQVNPSVKITSAAVHKNWVVWNDQYTIDLHAHSGKFVKNGLVIRVVTDGVPDFEIKAAMHH